MYNKILDTTNINDKLDLSSQLFTLVEYENAIRLKIVDFYTKYILNENVKQITHKHILVVIDFQTLTKGFDLPKTVENIETDFNNVNNLMNLDEQHLWPIILILMYMDYF